MDRRRTFDGVAETYHAIRPGYPPALFDTLFRALPADPLILEVGPGTGQATRDLLARGARVHAVELGPALAATLRRELPSERLTVEVGDFEEVPGPEAGSTFDAVFSASAYHWIDRSAQLDRPATLLKPGGMLAIVFYVQVDAPEDDGFFAAAQPIYERHGLPHEGPPAPSRADVDTPLRAALDADERFEPLVLRRWDWDQTYTAVGYRRLQETFSTTQLLEPDARQALLDELESFIRERFGGAVTRPLVATLTLARLASASTAARRAASPNRWYSAPSAREWTAPSGQGSARAFHRSLAGYAVTPLVEVPALAAALGVGRLLVKDESSRFGLPAFKILGASWACHQVLERHPGAELVTATDGNHGRAVAFMAERLGVAATVFVPEVMLPATAERITAEGARVVTVGAGYDEAVRAAAAYTDEDAAHRALVQDTAWDGYTEVPAWIVEGYGTMLDEVDEQLGAVPDIVVVPVGVGSLAEATVRHYRRPGTAHPHVMLVEPENAACVLTSLLAGSPVDVPTGSTVMAGLNCGAVSRAAWPILRSGADAAIAVSDDDALRAVDDLRALGIDSGPSGAATLAGLRAVMGDSDWRAALDVDDGSVVVLLSTEGDPR